MFDFTQAISGFIFLLIIIFLAPTLLVGGFAKMSGAKVRLPSVLKPVLKVMMDIAAGLAAVAEMVAQVVAERLPEKYEHLKPLATLFIKYAIIGIIALLFLRFFCSLAER